jgi:hypothetical protein
MTGQVERRARARRPLPPFYELAAFSVYGFCIAHGLSRSKFYGMLREGEGPRVMKAGTRTLISVEAAQAWRRARERVTARLRTARSPTARRVRKNHARDRVQRRKSAHARRH